MILRERDNTNTWTGSGDGTLEQRHYYAQNWRADVSALVSETGKMLEFVKYSAYGTPRALPAGDTNSDGAWDLGDSGSMGTTDSNNDYDVRADADLNGTVDGSADAAHANSIIGGGGGYQTLGWTKLSSTALFSRLGYAGYAADGVLSENRIYHVRHRVFSTDLGRWTRRDPLGYVDGMGLYTLSITVINPIFDSKPGIGSVPAAPIIATAFKTCESKCKQGEDDPAPPGSANGGTDPGNCDRQSQNAVCASEAFCGSSKFLPGRSGCITPPGGGTIKICCVCDSNIQLQFPDPDQLNQMQAIMSCVEEHEKVHRDDQGFCPSEEKKNACEAYPYKLEINCLKQKLKSGVCKSSPNPAQCQSDIQSRIDLLQDQLGKILEKCLATK